MRTFLGAVLPLAAAVFCDAAAAAQGPGTGAGTAGPLLQVFAVVCVTCLAALGVVFAPGDDGHYGDF